jgi:hypothetical protein
VIFILFNVYRVSVFADARWSVARVNVESLVVALVLLVVGIARTRTTFISVRCALVSVHDQVEGAIRGEAIGVVGLFCKRPRWRRPATSPA